MTQANLKNVVLRKTRLKISITLNWAVNLKTICDIDLSNFFLKNNLSKYETESIVFKFHSSCAP